jgi:hypothetical protein
VALVAECHQEVETVRCFAVNGDWCDVMHMQQVDGRAGRAAHPAAVPVALASLPFQPRYIAQPRNGDGCFGWCSGR